MSRATRASNEEWDRVIALGARLHLRGFTPGRVLGSTDHEVRALDGRLLDPTRFVTIAGDKSGRLYGGVFDPRTGEPHCPWAAISPVPGLRPPRVIDALRLVDSARGLEVAVGTRGDGLWMLPLSSEGRPCPQQAVQLPGTEDLAVRQVLFDRGTSSLLGASGDVVRRWSLAEAAPRLTACWTLPARVTALELCEGESDALDDDVLWLATNDGALHRLPRKPNEGFSLETLGDHPPRWQDEEDVVQTLVPLSAFGTPGPSGVVAGTLRHLIVLWNDQEATRRVVSNTELLHLAPLRSPRRPGLLAFTLDATALLMRRADRPGRPDTPQDPGEALLSDVEPIECFTERVYASCSIPGVERAPAVLVELPVVVGMGNHQVRLHHFTERDRLEQELRAAVGSLVKRHGIRELLDQLERWALGSAREHRELKRTHLALLPKLAEHCGCDEDWERIPRLLWDLLARSEDMPDVPVMAVQCLRRLQRLQRQQGRHDATLERLVVEIRKFVLDRKSFSGKHARFLELAGGTDPALADDRVVYRSILISRRQDPIFHRSFDSNGEFGEIRAFAPMTGPATSGQGNRWDQVPPEQLRMIATTFRGAIWMFDGTGEARRLHREAVGRYIRNLYFRGEDLVLALTDGTLQSVDRRSLMRAWDEQPPPPLELRSLRPPGADNPHVYSFCVIPGVDRWAERRFLTGDMEGRIALEGDGERRVLVDLGAHESPGAQGRRQVYDMRSSRLRFGERSHRVVVACTTTGYVHLLRWTDDPTPALEPEGLSIRLDRACVCLLYPDPEVHQVVVGSRDGTVAAFQIVERGDGRALVLLPIWAYQTAEEVRAVHMYAPWPRDDDPGEPRGPLVMVASHDQHVHALDLQGRQLEVYLLEGMKVDRFMVGHPTTDDDHDTVDARIYACAFENHVRAVRLISRRRLLQRFERQLPAPGPEREHTLARWRAYAIREGHLRHRFILQSERYPGSDPRACLTEIHALLAGEDSSERRTGELTALLRRLFTGPPRPRPRSGLQEILSNPPLYLATIELLKDLANRWSTPGSVENRKVQLHWIRSFLREVDDRDTLARWSAVADEVEPIDSVLDYRPGPLLLHFLQHPNGLIQFKTLEYLERMLFGWPGVDARGLLLRPEGIRAADLEWIVDALLDRLRFERRPINSSAPSAIVLSVSRILTLLMLHGLRDPIYLAYQLRGPGVDASIYPVLAHQAEATRSLAECSRHGLPSVSEEDQPACVRRLDRAALVMQRVHRLNHALASRHHHADGHARVLVALRGVLKQCRDHPADGPDRIEVEEIRRYFELLLPVLNVEGLEDLRKLDPRVLQAVYGPRLFPSVRALAHLEPVLEAATAYAKRKWRDWDEGMKSLRFIDMDLWRHAWRHAREMLDRVPADGFQDLLACLEDRWTAILDEEQDRRLLQDMTGLVEGFLLSNPPHEIPADREAAVRVLDEESDLVRQAFTSYVTRLALFARPDEAVFFYLDPDSKKVRGRMLLPTDQPEVRNLVHFDDRPALPPWVSPEWKDPLSMATLEKDETKAWLDATQPQLEWEVNGLSFGDEDESSRFRAFYVLGWRIQDRQAEVNHARFTDHRLAWDFLLDAIDLRQSSIIHRVEVGRFYTLLAHNLGTPLYHIKSDLQILLDGFFEGDAEKRQEKYRDLLRSARHMDGQFDSILSLSGRRIRLDHQAVFVAQVVYDVVRTVRKSDARAKGTNIMYPRPSDSPGRYDVLVTDEERLFDVVLSLVTNAVKYGPRGSTVEVVAQCSERGADIRVVDRGPGVSAEDRPFIFDPFYRGLAARHSGETGVGLGLYTARRFSELLGGRVNVSNNDDGGATFSLFIPRSAEE